MRAALLLLLLSLALAPGLWAAPFAGEPSIWKVKISADCTRGPGLVNSTQLEGSTGLYGCYAGDGLDEDYYVVCNATHLTSYVFLGSSRSEPCHGDLQKTVVLPLNRCVLRDWTGRETGNGYTYKCQGMWCNSTCDKPPCPLDFPCPQETACCLNDNRFETPCGTVEGCSGGFAEESWIWGLLRKVLLLGIVVCAILYAWQMGWCNICPWRRPYSTLYGEMA